MLGFYTHKLVLKRQQHLYLLCRKKSHITMARKLYLSMDQKLGKGPGHLLSIDDGTHAWPEVVEMLMSSFTFGSKWGPKASGEWGSREDLGRRATILGNHCWQISLWLSNAYLAESLPSMVENLIGKTGYHSSINWIH